MAGLEGDAVSGTSADALEGTYRQPFLRRHVVVAAALLVADFALVALLFDTLSDRIAGCVNGILLIVVLPGIATYGPRTVVGPEELRVRPMLRWQTIAWNDVTEVREPGRWDLKPVVAVTIRNGVHLALPHVPVDVADELRQYAEAHGSLSG